MHPRPLSPFRRSFASWGKIERRKGTRGLEKTGGSEAVERFAGEIFDTCSNLLLREGQFATEDK